jgi:inward rectifier potassium channel
MAQSRNVRRYRHLRIRRIGEREIVSEGLRQRPLGDFYHRAMTATWLAFFAGALAVFLALNLFFALLYGLGRDPVANAPDGLLSLFFFSVETMATVGFGDMHPQTPYAHAIATAEIFSGLSLIALMTGLIFSRFSRPRARFMFANRIVIGQHDGKPTLMVRIANARQNSISDANARLWLLTTEQTVEGRRYRRYRELKLVRNENPTFALSWTLFHVLDGSSAMHGMTAHTLEASDAGLLLTVAGLDDESSQELHARHTYAHSDIAWQHRYADIVNLNHGRVWIDFSRLHEIEPDLPAPAITVLEPTP